MVQNAPSTSNAVLSAAPLPANGAESGDIRDFQVVKLVLENLTSATRSAMALLDGPLKDTVQKRLHDASTLPDSDLSNLAAETIDVLHKAQLALEPRSTILADHFLGFVQTKCLNAVVDRGVADTLDDNGPMSLAQLTEATNAKPDRLRQVLRVLYNNGIFDYDESTGLYSNNGASTLLCTTHWTQWRNWVDLYGNQMYDIACGIPHATSKDSTRTAAQIKHETDLSMFEYFRQRGWVELLHKTLGGGAQAMAPGVMEDYPWASLAQRGALILDIGGGAGGFIASLLRRFEGLRGGVFDLPHVIEHASHAFHQSDGQYADLGARVAPECLFGGDFFQSVPRAEVYTMKWCLHDWNDTQCLSILRNIRKSIIASPDSRLVVLETVLADGRSKRLSRFGDIHMMMMANGQERSEAQWHQLCASSGWEIRKIYDLRNAWFKAIEMIPSNKGYEMGHDDAEVQRLASQHEWIKHSMGALLHCPVDTKKANMRILDSGTSDGYWLVDLAPTLPESTSYIGTDIATHLFPRSLPANVQLVEQSVTDPFPPEWLSSFDVVHQRLVLAACDPAAAKLVVQTLFSLVKPGGWIQLIECDHSGGFSDAQKALCPATTKFGQVVMKMLAAAGRSGQYGPSLREWLRDAGAVDVVETLMDCPIGARASTPELRMSTKDNLLSVLGNLKTAAKGTKARFPFETTANIVSLSNPADNPNLGMDASYFEDLHSELSTELAEKGSTQRYHIVYGRRAK